MLDSGYYHMEVMDSSTQSNVGGLRATGSDEGINKVLDIKNYDWL